MKQAFAGRRYKNKFAAILYEARGNASFKFPNINKMSTLGSTSSEQT